MGQRADGFGALATDAPAPLLSFGVGGGGGNMREANHAPLYFTTTTSQNSKQAAPYPLQHKK